MFLILKVFTTLFPFYKYSLLILLALYLFFLGFYPSTVKLRRIKTDLQELLDQLAKGNKLGDQIKGVVYEVFKARVKNSDSARGKSGGYRVIYQCKDEQIVLITIYSKSEQQDIEPFEIQQIISDYDTQILFNSENTVQEPSSEIVNNPEDTPIEPEDKV